ncbi:hypothetical protein J132_00232 [Termitomyces sp. J132]|nr:hypothetical protein H2248_012311 [Termitomyces sp. 'cryptogamus']KNZ76079.1 hypothetical protein J132_00232 [Termitomyces sp. J132]
MERISWVPNVALSGVTAIPVEVLDLIFESAVTHALLGHSSSMTSVPWTLTLVCSQWRQLALKNDKLWWRLHMDLDGTKKPFKLLDTLQAMGLARRISFVRIDHAGRFPVHIKTRWDMILPYHGMHVEEFMINLSHSSILPFLFHGPGMVKLKKLSMTFYPPTAGTTIQWRPVYQTIVTTNNPTIFGSMRNLRALEIVGPSRSAPEALIHCKEIPWSQLTIFRFACPGISMASLQSCLSKCASLLSLSLEIFDTGVHNLPKIDDLPKLITLHYEMGRPECLHLLGIPWKQLKVLRINGSSDNRYRIRFSELVCALYDLEKVEMLTLHAIHPDDYKTKVDSLRQLYLPQLKSLQFKTSCPQILALFRVPALLHLSVDVHGGHTVILTPLLQVIKASSCAIRTFCCYDGLYQITQTLIPAAETGGAPDYLIYRSRRLKRLANFLAKYMPRLERFEGFTLNFPITLMLKLAAGLVLPRLQNLRCCLPSSHVDLLLDVIAARAKGRGHSGKVWKVFAAIYGEVSEPTRARIYAVGPDMGIIFVTRNYEARMFKGNFL